MEIDTTSANKIEPGDILRYSYFLGEQEVFSRIGMVQTCETYVSTETQSNKTIKILWLSERQLAIPFKKNNPTIAIVTMNQQNSKAQYGYFVSLDGCYDEDNPQTKQPKRFIKLTT